MVLASAVVPVRHDGGLVGDGVVAPLKPACHKRAVAAVKVVRRHAHLSDDEAVAKMGHTVPGQVPVNGPMPVRMEDGFTARRVLLAFDEASQISYAAVPVRNGWLIFQL